VKACSCGQLVEDHVRFHWTGPEHGHYVEEELQVAAAAVPGGMLIPESWPKHLVFAASFFAGPPYMAPPPGEVPPKPWGKEATLRRLGLQFLKGQGYGVWDLEQGYRAESGGSRQGSGIGDAYVIRQDVRAWIEFKRYDNEPSDAQVAFGTAVLDAGGIYLLIYEVDQLVRWHQALGR
jgi:hypothetical protein